MERVFRREVALTTAAAFGAPAVFFALATLNDAEVTEHVVTACVALVFGVLAVRSLRLGLYYDDDTVVVRNIFRTHRWSWREIAAVGMRRAAPFGVPTPSLQVGDRWVPIRGTEPPNQLTRPNNKDAQRAVDRVQRELDRRRSRAG